MGGFGEPNDLALCGFGPPLDESAGRSVDPAANIRYRRPVESGEVGYRAIPDRLGRRLPITDSVDRLRLAALAGLCLDGATTWFVLVLADYRELNPFISGLWDGHPLLVVGYFGGFALAVAASTRRRGRLSTAVSAYVAVVMGVFGGCNNLLLFAFDTPGLLGVLADTIGVSSVAVVVSVVPMCGLLVAGSAVGFRHGRLPRK